MPPALRGFFGHEYETDRGECLLKKGKGKKKKNKEQNKLCSLSAVVVCPADMMSTVLS